MTFTEERAERCAAALTSYSDDETYINLVDWLADALHWCHQHEHDMTAAFDSAAMHFDAEITEGVLS